MPITDNLPNRAYIDLAFNATTTTAEFATLDTEMGARSGLGWLITRVDIAPKVVGNTHTSAGTDRVFKLMTGTQTLMSAESDEQNIATITDERSIAGAAGIGVKAYPLVWLGPVLVANKKLTFGVDTSVADSGCASVVFTMTIWYFWQDMKTAEWIEAYEAKGQF